MGREQTIHGLAIRSLMTKRGLTITGCAERIGVSRQSIQSWLRRDVRMVSMERLLEVMGASWSDFESEMKAVQAKKENDE